jgi:hypothetical protein
LSFTTVNAGDEILAEHIQELQGALTGNATDGQQVLLTDYSSADNYSFTVKNPGAGGKAVNVKASTGNDLLLINDSSSVLKSADGTDYITVSNSGVAITGAFSINGQSVGAGLRVYNVLDHGIAGESTATSTLAATNSTALAALWVTVATAGGGTIYFPPNSTGQHYALNATTLNHALGYTVSVNIQGGGYGTLLKFFGTTGPFLDVATASTSAVTLGYIRDLAIGHAAEVTSGSTIRFGQVSSYKIENVHILFSGSTLCAYSALTLGNGTLVCLNTKVINCFWTVTDTKSNAPIISLAGSVANGGLAIINSALEGGSTTGKSNIIGILCGASALWDGIQIINSGIGKVKRGISVGNTSVANVQITSSYLDSTGEHNILVTGTAGTTANTWQLSNVWMASDATHIELAASTGQAHNWLIDNCYLTNATASSIIASGGIKNLIIRGCLAGATIGSAIPVWDIQAGENVIVANNIVTGGGSASSSIAIAAGVDPVVLIGNLNRGVNDSFGGATDASRIDADNAFQA